MKQQPNKAVIALLALIVVVIVGTVFVLSGYLGHYTYYVKDVDNDLKLESIDIRDKSVTEVQSAEVKDGYLEVVFKAKNPGATGIQVDMSFEGSKTTMLLNLTVNKLGMVYRAGFANFDGWPLALLSATIVLVLLTVIFMVLYVSRIRRDLYSYRTLQRGGIAIFLTLVALLFVLLCVFLLPRYKDYSLDIMYMFMRNMTVLFDLAALPFVLVFGAALSISNVRLIQKEGFRTVNLLGIALSVFLIICTVLSVYFADIIHVKNLEDYRVLLNMQVVFSAVFCFFLCFLLSTMICGLIAAKRVPACDKDFIIILGCGIRKDGTLYPLLQGRVDRAIWFWKRQLEQTGKKAVFVPSGGQGADEVMPEGEAMKRYLLEQGIPEECILPETESKNTLQNMAFSKKLIDARMKDAKVMFSTTNYHVFRSGMLANQAGLHAVGLGAKSRWYFWPNAFVREFAGLVVSSWKFLLAIFLVVAVIQGIITVLV